MYQIFSIAIPNDSEGIEALNTFLASHRVVHTTHQLVMRDGVPYWSFLLKYVTVDGVAKRTAATGDSLTSGTQHIDYQKVLSTEDFRRYDCLRDMRKTIGNEAGVKLFTVMTNAELAAIAKANPQNLEELKAVDGVSHERLERYGERFWDALSVLSNDEEQTENKPEVGK